MAEIIKTDWAALARSLWRQPQVIIHAPGPHVVAVRCHFPAPVALHLFDNDADARAFSTSPCCETCSRKHSCGNIERFVPPILPRTPAPEPPPFVKKPHWFALIEEEG